jgi:predicted phosphodiesterase
MRFAVMSDIHGNLFAFQAALARMAGMELDAVVCLGDIVGYGPHPAECIDLVVRHASWTVQGNHDRAVVDPDTAAAFNGAAREAVIWTRGVLGPLHLNALVKLKPTLRIGKMPGGRDVNVEILCVHDCPYPGPTDYVHDKQVAALAFRGVDAPICLLGHTHVPMVFETESEDPAAELTARDVTAYIPGDAIEIELRPGHRYICNPGSIGQPRDCDPRASFAILDVDARTFTVHRVEYDIAAAQAETQRAGLPTILADRLAIGA